MGRRKAEVKGVSPRRKGRKASWWCWRGRWRRGRRGSKDGRESVKFKVENRDHTKARKHEGDGGEDGGDGGANSFLKG